MEGWDMSGEWHKKAGKQARLGEEIKLKIMELDVPLEDTIEVLRQEAQKRLRTRSRMRRQGGYSSGETTIVGG